MFVPGVRDGGNGFLAGFLGGNIVSVPKIDGASAEFANDVHNEFPCAVLRDLEGKGGQTPVDDGQAGSSDFLLAESTSNRSLVDGCVDAHGFSSKCVTSGDDCSDVTKSAEATVCRSRAHDRGDRPNSV